MLGDCHVQFERLRVKIPLPTRLLNVVGNSKYTNFSCFLTINLWGLCRTKKTRLEVEICNNKFFTINLKPVISGDYQHIMILAVIEQPPNIAANIFLTYI